MLLQEVAGQVTLAIENMLAYEEIASLKARLEQENIYLQEEIRTEHNFEEIVGQSAAIRKALLIAATNRKLTEAVKSGSFRSDLFYRLNVFPLTLPALRERREDIPLLVSHFLSRFTKKFGKTLERLSKESMDRLMRYDWPGNVRELLSVIERAAILARGPVVHVEDSLDLRLRADADGPGLVKLEDLERSHIIRVLDETNWMIDGPRGAALILGLHSNTLRSRMQKLGIKKLSSLA
jgi:transcriptional regulator with GAF, ATPase, and Fis domain